MSADRWTTWRFLLGEWVRRGFAHFAATDQRAAHAHEDLLYVHPDGDRWQAVYFDNEGHVLRYRAASEDGRARFETDADERGLRYRLTYEPHDGGLTVSFAIAPPGGDFTAHVGGPMERKR